MDVLFLLVAAHALCDFALQPEAMGNGKSRRRNLRAELGREFPPWYVWLSAHGLIHGGAVAWITGAWSLGVIESTLHAVIDHMKCEHRITFAQDQMLHLLCKGGYAWFVFATPQSVP